MSQGSTFENEFHRKGGAYNCIPTRYVVAAMCFCGIFFQFIIKVTLSVVIVAMVRPVTTDSTNTQQLSDILTTTLRSEEEQDVCPGGNVDNETQSTGEFEWDEKTQGLTLSAYYYGYVATQVLGGRLSEIFGSKVVLGPGVLIAGLITVLSPMAARLHVSAFIAARVLVGAASGLIIPSMYHVLSKWFVVEERLFIGSVMISGVNIGTVIAMLLSGYLADLGGWPLVFYIFGGIAVCFIIPWIFLMYDTPEKHPRISDEEKNFILKSLGNDDEGKTSYPVPWVAILTSGPLWAHIIMGMGYCWVSYTLLSELPTYLSKILHFDLQVSGVISALPYIFSSITAIVSGYLSQWLHIKGYLSHLTVYRIFNGISGLGSAACLLTITFMGCNSTVIVILLVLTVSTSATYQGGSYINHVDLGSNFSGTTAGISFTLLNSMGIISPSITGVLINEKQTLTQWKIVFYIAMAIAIGTWLIYLLFGKVEEQPWNRITAKEKISEECTTNSEELKTRRRMYSNKI